MEGGNVEDNKTCDKPGQRQDCPCETPEPQRRGSHGPCSRTARTRLPPHDPLWPLWALSHAPPESVHWSPTSALHVVPEWEQQSTEDSPCASPPAHFPPLPIAATGQRLLGCCHLSAVHARQPHLPQPRWRSPHQAEAPTVPGRLAHSKTRATGHDSAVSRTPPQFVEDPGTRGEPCRNHKRGNKRHPKAQKYIHSMKRKTIQPLPKDGRTMNPPKKRRAWCGDHRWVLLGHNTRTSTSPKEWNRHFVASHTTQPLDQLELGLRFCGGQPGHLERDAHAPFNKTPHSTQHTVTLHDAHRR